MKASQNTANYGYHIYGKIILVNVILGENLSMFETNVGQCQISVSFHTKLIL